MTFIELLFALAKLTLPSQAEIDKSIDDGIKGWVQ